MKVGRQVVSVVASLAALLVAAGLLWGAWALVMDDDVDPEASELASLRSAPVCDSPPTEPDACTWDGEFEFVGSERHRPKRGDDWYSFDLRDVRPDEDGSPGFVQTVEFSSDVVDGDDVEGLTYRTPVDATVWRGRIIEVRIDGRELPTKDYPQGTPERVPAGQRPAVVIFAGAFVVAAGLLPYLHVRRAKAAARNEAMGD